MKDYPPSPPPSPRQKKGRKVLDHYLHHDLGMPPLLWCFFLLIYSEYPDHHQNLISSSLYYPGPLHKISSQSVHTFLSNVHRQTNKQTNATKNITSFAKEVINNMKFSVLSANSMIHIFTVCHYYMQSVCLVCHSVVVLMHYVCYYSIMSHLPLCWIGHCLYDSDAGNNKQQVKPLKLYCSKFSFY